jgi:hypothetical protein
MVDYLLFFCKGWTGSLYANFRPMMCSASPHADSLREAEAETRDCISAEKDEGASGYRLKQISVPSALRCYRNYASSCLIEDLWGGDRLDYSHQGPAKVDSEFDRSCENRDPRYGDEKVCFILF